MPGPGRLSGQAGTDVERSLREIFARHTATPADAAMQTLSAPAFRALVAERLRSLERDLGEVRSRINGLLFLVLGAVITQVVLRALG
jgi:hypothetical protein